jgi:hypothetical protein
MVVLVVLVLEVGAMALVEQEALLIKHLHQAQLVTVMQGLTVVVATEI